MRTSWAGVVVVVWLVIGVLAAYQRGHFGDDRAVSCKTFETRRSPSSPGRSNTSV